MPRIVNPQIITAYTAEGAATQYQAVGIGTADTQVDCTPAANAQCLGIAFGSALDTEQVDVVTTGAFIGIANGAIPRGAHVRIAATTGRLEAVTPAAPGATVNNTVGIALEAAAGAGEEFSLLIQPAIVQS